MVVENYFLLVLGLRIIVKRIVPYVGLKENFCRFKYKGMQGIVFCKIMASKIINKRGSNGIH